MKNPFISLGAFALGIILALLVPSIFPPIAFLGTIYINLLKAMIVPVLFFSIASALANSKRAGTITWKTIILFVAMFVLSFLLCSGLWTLIQPGAGFPVIEGAYEGELITTSLESFFVSIFPSNVIAAASANQILPVILFAFAFGIALQKADSSMLIGFFNSCNTVINKILEWIMYFTPIGIFSLIGNTIVNYGNTILTNCAIYIGSAWLGCLLICALVMILPVWVYCHVNPIEYIKKVCKVWLITISTCSSAATLPVTIQTCNEEFNIPKEVTDIVVPLGCTIHMCGGAVSFSLLAFFTYQMYGITITPIMFITMLIAALLINMGAPGIPGGGIVIGASFLSILGVPLDFIGVYAGFYRLIDMCYTSMNVTGDISANLLLNKHLG